MIDTNLLVLLVVGLTDEGYIEKHDNLAAYSAEDFRRLLELIGSHKLLFVPHVLSETSNLLRQIKDPIRSELMARFGELIKRVEEKYVGGASVAELPVFVRLGLTDAVLARLTETGAALLTADSVLWDAVTRAGHMAVNYNHIRDSDPSFNPWANT